MKKSKVFIGIIAICLAIGVFERLLYCIRYPVMVRDSYIYCDIIKEWNATGQFRTEGTLPPLSLYLLRIPSHFFSYDIMKGGVLVNVLFGIAIIALSILIVHCICNNLVVDFIFGILVSTHPTLVYYSCQMTRENPYLFFMFLTCLMLIIGTQKKRMIYFMLTGLFSAAAYLCRHEALELVLITILTIFFFSEKKAWRVCLKRLFVFMLIYIISFAVITYSIGIPIQYYYGYYEELENKTLESF